jgi:hypothetical protein
VIFETAETAIKTPLVDSLVGSECLHSFMDLYVSTFHVIQDFSQIRGDVPTSQDILF